MNSAHVHLLPASADLLDHAAARLLAKHRADLPDISRVTVLIPDWGAAPRLRRALAQIAQRGLLGPVISMLPQFVQSRAPQVAALPALDCRLRLTAALSRYRNLFSGADPHGTADSLFALFEEMIAHGLTPGDDEALFAGRLQKAYGAPSSAFLSREAKIVQLLFNAYRSDTGNASPAAAYRRQLHDAFTTLAPDESLYLLGFDTFSAAEAAAIKPLLESGRAELILHGRRDGYDGAAIESLCRLLSLDPSADIGEATPLSSLADIAFSKETGPVTRLAEAPALFMVEAGNPEHEARCVDLAIRRALLEDASCDIAVVTDDRRLARRLRALLERAGVSLHDPVGWALSTSRAAAFLNAWLDCLASGFHFRPLLTLLKSPFVDSAAEALRFLEQDLIYRRHCERGLELFISCVPAEHGLHHLLMRLHQAAQTCPSWNEPVNGDQRCLMLLQSLRTLGADKFLQSDEAGARLLVLLEAVARALRAHPQKLDGDQLRGLLDRVLERETFVPERGRGPVRLLTLEQSANLRCDRVILAGATRDQWPGTAPADPVFNASVRRELGLPDWQGRYDLTLARLRRVLHAAPQVWVTYAPEKNGEAAVLCPWLEALENVARQAGESIRDTRLAQQALDPACEIVEAGTPLPARSRRPAPATAPDLIPDTLSASAHQSLVDCPYQFFGRALLQLRTEQAPDEDPDRSDYGERVHRILRRFAETSGPQEDRAVMSTRLQQIAADVFGPDLRTRALAQFWVAEFNAGLATLLDWLEQRSPARVHAEVELTCALGERQLLGRLDRLEEHGNGTLTVVDYKTGHVASKKEVESAEDVQLLHYAALDARIARAEYLALKRGKKSVSLEEGLVELRQQALERLQAGMRRMQAGAALPAHGDEDTCEHCDYRGVCRKGDWPEGAPDG